MAVALDATLLEILACPSPDHAPLPGRLTRRPRCRRADLHACGRMYPVRDGIPVLLLDEAILPESSPADVRRAGEPVARRQPAGRRRPPGQCRRRPGCCAPSRSAGAQVRATVETADEVGIDQLAERPATGAGHRDQARDRAAVAAAAGRAAPGELPGTDRDPRRRARAGSARSTWCSCTATTPATAARRVHRPGPRRGANVVVTRGRHGPVAAAAGRARCCYRRASTCRPVSVTRGRSPPG